MSGKIKVPVGMQMAGFDALSADEQRGYPPAYYAFLYAALRWLSENPIVPTEEQCKDIERTGPSRGMDCYSWIHMAAVEWQRRMFLAPDPDEPIRDLLCEHAADGCVTRHNQNVREAYRRGRKEAKK